MPSKLSGSGRRRSRQFTPSDVDKKVVTTSGEVVGRIDRIRGDRAFVRPEQGLLEGVGSWIGNPWSADEPFPLDWTQVDAVEDVVVLKPIE